MLTEFEAMEANLRQSFRVLAEGRPHADIAELDGVSIASLGAAFQMFNAAFLNSPVPDRRSLEERLVRAGRLFASRCIPWSFWICEDWLARSAKRALTNTCESADLRPVAEMPAMVTDSLRERSRLGRRDRSRPALEIRRAIDVQTLRDFRAIGSVCFHVPPAWFGEVFNDTMPARDFICWVGYRDDVPIATAATVVSDGVIGVYNVATIPEERGKGYGEAITRYAIESASHGAVFRHIILQSTTHGQRLYKRLGFREISRVVVFNSI